MKQLVKLNTKKTQIIVKRFSSTRAKKFIFSLNDHPDLQLEYLQKLIEDSKKDTEEIDDDLKILLLQLMCKLDKSKVLKMLKDMK